MENQIEILHDINNYGLFNLFSVELSWMIWWCGRVERWSSNRMRCVTRNTRLVHLHMLVVVVVVVINVGGACKFCWNIIIFDMRATLRNFHSLCHELRAKFFCVGHRTHVEKGLPRIANHIMCLFVVNGCRVST